MVFNGFHVAILRLLRTCRKLFSKYDESYLKFSTQQLADICVPVIMYLKEKKKMMRIQRLNFHFHILCCNN